MKLRKYNKLYRETDRTTQVKMYKTKRGWVQKLLAWIGVLRVFKNDATDKEVEVHKVELERTEEEEKKQTENRRLIKSALTTAALVGVGGASVTTQAYVAKADTTLATSQNLSAPSENDGTSTTESTSQTDEDSVSASKSLSSSTSESVSISQSASILTSESVSTSQSLSISLSESTSLQKAASEQLLLQNKKVIVGRRLAVTNLLIQVKQIPLKVWLVALQVHLLLLVQILK